MREIVPKFGTRKEKNEDKKERNKVESDFGADGTFILWRSIKYVECSGGRECQLPRS